MTGKKSSREKRRKRGRSETAMATAPMPAGGERRKRRSTESASLPVPQPQEMKCPLPSVEREKEKEVEEPSDIEEGGLDLTVSLKPVSFYIADKKEMLQQCFCVIGEKKLQRMLPDVLKNCSIEEIKKLCQEQLELLSEKKLLKILEGENGIDSDTEEEADDGSKMGSESVSQQDNSVDSTSSLRENKQPEGLELKQGCHSVAEPSRPRNLHLGRSFQPWSSHLGNALSS
ncbi:caspase activity and apoptosis inhibitor 1 isoform X5 [Petaurus breviceps papuanus]|uniref:caspase activity and apoptosis inhibitor 1 isoform X5 n=1 Tax=Petaurus breviceps papuanus TaxID=3040969 RepID=UPI0036D7E7BE